MMTQEEFKALKVGDKIKTYSMTREAYEIIGTVTKKVSPREDGYRDKVYYKPELYPEGVKHMPKVCWRLRVDNIEVLKGHQANEPETEYSEP